MIIFRYALVSFIIYLIFLFTSAYFYFDEFTNSTIKQEENLRKIKFNYFKEKVENSILHNKYTITKKYLDKLTSNNNYKFVKLSYIKHYLTNESIIIHANKNIDMSWQLNDVTTDAKYGTIQTYTSTIYDVISAPMYDFDEMLIIKAQAENQSKIINIVSGINYILPQYQNDNLNEENDDFLINKLKYLIQIPNHEELVLLFINNNEYAQIFYKHSNNYIFKILKNKLMEFFEYFNILYFSMVFIYLIFNYIIMQSTTNNYLKLLKHYTDDILNNNFYKFDSNKLMYQDIRDVSDDISKLSKKMATIINELNINKNVLDLKVSTDNLTNLPNNKIFEQDMKDLFLDKTPSYIVKIKLVCLSTYSNNNSTANIDNLILGFVNILNNSIEKSNKEIALYRLYGSEFYLIIKDINFENMNIYLNTLSNSIVSLKDDFTINTKISHMISIPFDHYSNTKELLSKINILYNKTINIPKQISFYNEDNKKQNEENEKLIKIVHSIINNNAFTLSYKYDTYDYASDKLIMKEVSPNLINYDGSNIAIGTFVSVASEFKLAIDFDKDVIEKAFNFIDKNKIDYKLAVNIAIDSMIDPNFLTWVESKLLYDYDGIKNNIVFSITSFAAKNNFEEFIKFCNNIKRFGGQVILKRFNYNDLTQDQLEQLDLNYIRVHSDYTNDIDKHKESILRNISDFCISHNINLLADMVKEDKNHLFLKTNNFYGTSKEVKL